MHEFFSFVEEVSCEEGERHWVDKSEDVLSVVHHHGVWVHACISCSWHSESALFENAIKTWLAEWVGSLVSFIEAFTCFSNSSKCIGVVLYEYFCEVDANVFCAWFGMYA